MTLMRLFGICFGLVVANFIYQSVNSQDWALAVDRSYFQAAALFCVWLDSIFRGAPIDFYPSKETRR